jgi:hypothetical protein
MPKRIRRWRIKRPDLGVLRIGRLAKCLVHASIELKERDRESIGSGAKLPEATHTRAEMRD